MTYKSILFVVYIAILRVSSLTTEDYIDLCNKDDLSFLTEPTSRIVFIWYQGFGSEIRSYYSNVKNLVRKLQLKNVDSPECNLLLQTLTIIESGETSIENDISEISSYWSRVMMGPGLTGVKTILKDLLTEYHQLSAKAQREFEDCLLADAHPFAGLFAFVGAITHLPKCLKKSFKTPYCEPIAKLTTFVQQTYDEANKKSPYPTELSIDTLQQQAEDECNVLLYEPPYDIFY